MLQAHTEDSIEWINVWTLKDLSLSSVNFFHITVWLNNCFLRPNFLILISTQRKALGTSFWGRRWWIMEQFLLFKHRGFYATVHFRKTHRKKDRTFTSIHVTNKPCHGPLKIIPDKDRGWIWSTTIILKQFPQRHSK